MVYAAPLVLGSELTITRGQTLRVASVDLAPKVLVPYEVNSIRMLGYPSIEVEDVAAGPSTALRGFLKFKFEGGHFFPPPYSLRPVVTPLPGPPVHPGAEFQQGEEGSGEGKKECRSRWSPYH